MTSIFTNNADSRGRVWLNGSHTCSMLGITWEDLLEKIVNDKSLRFLENENISENEFR